MTPQEWKEKVRALAHAAVWRQNFGHKCDLQFKAEGLINEVVNDFLIVYPYSRRYETRRHNRENNIKGTFLDFISNDITMRSIFYNKMVEKVGGEFYSEGNLSAVVEPLAKKRNDNSKGYNASLRLVYGRMPVCWKNRVTRNNGATKQSIIMGDKKLQQLFRKTVEKMLEEINETNA